MSIIFPFATPCSVPIPSLSYDGLWSLQVIICICYLKFCSSFHSIFALKISGISIIILGPEECLALFLDKVPNVCQFEEKDWNFSSARKCSDVYSQVMYLFYSNTASCRWILSTGNLNNRIFFSDLLIQFISNATRHFINFFFLIYLINI